MIPYVLQIDEFFRRPERVQVQAVTRTYGPWTDESPAGEMEVYPHVSTDVSEEVKAEVAANLTGIMGRSVDVLFLGYRLNKADEPQPHWAHTDIGIGQYALTVYLTSPGACRGGTVILRHRENGMETNPTTAEEEALWRRDQKDESKWEVMTMSPMRFNRALIMPADLFHASMPKGGFGQTAIDGRLALIVFFNLFEGVK